MKSDINIQDLKTHSIYVKNNIDTDLNKPILYKSKRRSKFKGNTDSIYNENFSCMPTNN